MIVALLDKINIFNVLSKQLVQYKSLVIKQCKEVRFCNGGHLFAAAQSSSIQIFNFYTFELVYVCKGHQQKVRSIDWFPEDLGFVSCGQGGDVYFWDFINAKENQFKIQDKELTQKGVQFTSVCNIPKKTHQVFVVGNDKRIWNSDLK